MAFSSEEIFEELVETTRARTAWDATLPRLEEHAHWLATQLKEQQSDPTVVAKEKERRKDRVEYKYQQRKLATAERQRKGIREPPRQAQAYCRAHEHAVYFAWFLRRTVERAFKQYQQRPIATRQ